MEIANEMLEGRILRRYKRFLADVELSNGEIVTAHTPNTGSMTTCWAPGWPARLSVHHSPTRKLPYTLELTHNGRTWIGVNTGLPNRLAREAILNGQIAEIQGYAEVIPEVTMEEGRLDLLCTGHPTEPDCYVEVKNVTLWTEGDWAAFPDAVSERGQKHLSMLMDLRARGHRAAMLYVIQRQDVTAFRPAWEIDPRYALLLGMAAQQGVEILPYRCKMGEQSIEITSRLAWEI